MASYELEKGEKPTNPELTVHETSSHEKLGGPQYGSVEDGQLGFWTRMGCTPESFKRRRAVDENNQLNQTLKKRHLHMIAIGGSIGAGLFVGSGSALSRGVSSFSGSSQLIFGY